MTQAAESIVPGRERCLELLCAEGVPEHIAEHSIRVEQVCRRIGDALNANGCELDMVLVQAGALLHDISKFHTINNGGDHGALGGQRVRELGYPLVAPLVERHVDLGDWDPEGPVTEVELVNYCDKRVRHTEVVSLNERFHDLLERYGKTDKARERIGGHWKTMEALERKIFAGLPVGPEVAGQ